MEQQLTPEIVEVLDYILQKTLKAKSIFVDELKPIGNTPLSNITAVLNGDYKPYIEILDSYNLLEISRTLSEGYQLKPKMSITQQFVDNGGFKKLYADQQAQNIRKKEVEEIGYRKLISDAKLVELQLKLFWWVFAVAVVGGLCGIISLIMDVIKP